MEINIQRLLFWKYENNRRTIFLKRETKQRILWYMYVMKYLKISYEFIRRLLLLPNVQSYLIRILLVLPELSQALSILLLLSNCLFIRSIELSYCKNDLEVDSIDIIVYSKNSFTKKVGIIEELKVNLETTDS